MRKNRLLNWLCVLFVAALFVVTAWTMNTTWLWVALTAVTCWNFLDYFQRKDRAHHVNQ